MVRTRVGIVQRHTKELVDAGWSELFDVDRSDLWRAATLQPHGLLGDYPGVLVAWRGDGVHVSLPGGTEMGPLVTADVETLQSPVFWTSYAEGLGSTVIGPATHHYLDVDPATDDHAVPIEVVDLKDLRAVVSDEEWWESGCADDDVEVAFGLFENGVLVAAATLSTYADRPCDVGVLVASTHRGRRLVDAVGRAAASYAIRQHGLARWVARNDNRASMRAAARLGFEPRCQQLAVRIPPTSASS